MKMKMTVICLGILGTTLMLTGAEAEWRYTDDKGRSRTVVLKMDVPQRYSNTAVYVDLSARQDEPRRAETVVVPPVAEQPKVTVTPGAMWWTYPVGSPERAAAQKAASEKAAALRQLAGPEKSPADH
jgi:hypothetical protein